LGEAKRKATSQDAADVAGALVSIRTYFMPKRAKQKF
ncbi:YecA family protein, partial [Ensifer sp. T173]|nr:YecA family protein [Ensifer canadensis]